MSVRSQELVVVTQRNEDGNCKRHSNIVWSTRSYCSKFSAHYKMQITKLIEYFVLRWIMKFFLLGLCILMKFLMGKKKLCKGTYVIFSIFLIFNNFPLKFQATIAAAAFKIISMLP